MSARDGAAVLRTLGHPVRLAIFDLLMRAEGALSTRQIHGDLDGAALGVTAYHLGILASGGLIEAADERAGRRTREQFFTMSRRGQTLAPLVAQLLSESRPKRPA